MYPIHNGGPPFHCDTLKNGQHGESNIVKIGDSCKNAWMNINPTKSLK